MNPDIHYREIALVAAANAPVQWTRIEVPTEGGDHVSYSVLAYDDANTKHSYTIADYKAEDRVADALFALRKGMTEPGREPWPRATSTLHANGQFKFDVAYDD